MGRSATIQVKGFGHFSASGATQMIMQDTSGDASNGQIELYTYQPGIASFGGINVGKVGSNLSIVGTADLLGNGSTQMVMQQNNGNYWLYSYSAATNSLGGTLVGAIGSNFHVVGFGPLGTAGQDEMLMQDAAGDFEVYQYNASECLRRHVDGGGRRALGGRRHCRQSERAAEPQRFDSATHPSDGIVRHPAANSTRSRSCGPGTITAGAFGSAAARVILPSA